MDCQDCAVQGCKAKGGTIHCDLCAGHCEEFSVEQGLSPGKCSSHGPTWKRHQNSSGVAGRAGHATLKAPAPAAAAATPVAERRGAGAALVAGTPARIAPARIAPARSPPAASCGRSSDGGGGAAGFSSCVNEHVVNGASPDLGVCDGQSPRKCRPLLVLAEATPPSWSNHHFRPDRPSVARP